jgi:hypothetical protein
LEQDDWQAMTGFHYVYRLRSVNTPKEVYSGLTEFLFKQTRIGKAAWLPALFLLATTAGVQAQYSYTTNPFDTNTITITRYTGPGGAVTIPGTINGKKVTSIGCKAFADSTSLTSATIYDGATSIGDEAFVGCNNLSSITIPASVISIGTGAFCKCINLAGVYFKGNVPDTDWYVFYGAKNTIVYYLPATTGWGTTFCGRPTKLWKP